MKQLSKAVLACLRDKTLVTAESCTGGLIGSMLTAIAGSSRVYKGGIICYTNAVKQELLAVSKDLLELYGPVSEHVAMAMAQGVRTGLSGDVAVSVTGLAGPDGDGSENPVGTVYVGYADENCCFARRFLFKGSRESVRRKAARQALRIIIEMNEEKAVN